jgi:hypothetical protein
MKKGFFFGSMFSAVLLLLMCLPSVVAYREIDTIQDTTVSTIIDELINQLSVKPWQPGVFILLFMAVMQAVGEAIAQGQWFPGMISGAFILYLVLAWLIIFASDDVEIPS